MPGERFPEHAKRAGIDARGRASEARGNAMTQQTRCAERRDMPPADRIDVCFDVVVGRATLRLAQVRFGLEALHRTGRPPIGVGSQRAMRVIEERPVEMRAIQCLGLSVAFEPRRRLRDERVVGAPEVARLHADRLRLRLGFDRRGIHRHGDRDQSAGAGDLHADKRLPARLRRVRREDIRASGSKATERPKRWIARISTGHSSMTRVARRRLPTPIGGQPVSMQRLQTEAEPAPVGGCSPADGLRRSKRRCREVPAGRPLGSAGFLRALRTRAFGARPRARFARAVACPGNARLARWRSRISRSRCRGWARARSRSRGQRGAAVARWLPASRAARRSPRSRVRARGRVRCRGDDAAPARR